MLKTIQKVIYLTNGQFHLVILDNMYKESSNSVLALLFGCRILHSSVTCVTAALQKINLQLTTHAAVVSYCDIVYILLKIKYYRKIVT